MVAAGLLFCGFFSSLALGRSTAHDTLHVHERCTDVPSRFNYVGKADPSAVLDLRIALVQSDPVGLEAALYDVSTPGSKNYRQHLTKAQVNAFVAPKPGSVQVVKTWLSKNNVTVETVNSNGSWMNIRVPVSQANSLLDAQFNEYSHEETGLTALRTMSYSVPASVKGHLDFIYPATSKRATTTVVPKTTSSTSSKATATATPDDSCKTKITPACLQAICGIPSDATLNQSRNIFIANLVGESADPADLKVSDWYRRHPFNKCRPDVDNRTTFRVKGLDGDSNNRVKATIEASLDVQYAVGIATGIDTTFVSVGSNNSDDISGFLDVINDLIAQEEVPFVLTTSFGFDEKDTPVGLANNLCNAYAQLSARGTTNLFGSGDGGVSGIQTKNCTTFVPTFPVTSVGVSFSAGGFSNMFPRPNYQQGAVSAYLDHLGNGDTNNGLFNASGRAFPDIAAQAKSFQVVRGGQTISVSSTASPTVAGIVALLNDAIFNGGGKPLGFLNRFLYSDAKDALNDITQGNNPGCGTDGFQTSEGWDPVTGLGTPNFIKLLDTIQKSA
ncbi:subtilisin-like protein [Ganoderma leucocontextum]|nr:subtilisin-like protein [Ganoderma leucocontextum]